ncbi:MAG: tRNA (guanosine(18)-2'-O)-methyltransferase TrmH [Psychromonas sp.]|nr:tRNA (guanosine(18)-2'-O)-methyltransferase TrmH [Psychromonas sp.]
MSPERFARITQMLNRRQPELTVFLEQVHKPHNLGAIVRTSDAVGLSALHATWKTKSSRISGTTAMGSQHWLDIISHDTTDQAIQAFRDQGMQIIAANLSDDAIDFHAVDYTKPTAILIGQEKYGLSAVASARADRNIIIPMVGMCQSLNVSVASAIILYEAQRQRQNAGMYDGECMLSKEQQHRILFEGGHPTFAKLCRQKRVKYPPLDEQGQINASGSWWDMIRFTNKD